MKRIREFLAFAMLASSLTALQAQLADSATDFSDTQGQNGWFYGFYNLSTDEETGYDPNTDFTELPVHTGSAWRISDLFWTQIQAELMHPNSGDDNGDRTPQEHWTIRRWVSETTNRVRIRGHLAKAADTEGGNGVLTQILVNGEEVFRQAIGPNDTTGSNYSLGLSLTAGDLVDFVLSDAGNPFNDSTQFTATIEAEDFIISTQAAIEVNVPTLADQVYQLHHSLDLDVWTPIGEAFAGTGDVLHFLFSIRELGSPGFFKAEVVTE